MIKRHFLLLFLLIVAGAPPVHAQMVKDPTDWKVEVKKAAGGHYTVIYHLTLKPTWHLYAMKPGGDGSLVATRFSSTKTAGIKSIGAVRDASKPKTLLIEGVDGKANLYIGKADFKQDVIGARGQSFTTVVEYQSCSDKMCLPPKKLPLTIILP